MIGAADDAVIRHPLDQPRGGIVADAELALEPRGRGLLAFADELDGGAILLVLGRILAGRRAVEREALLRLLGDAGDIVGLPLRAPGLGDPLVPPVADDRVVDAYERLVAGLVKDICSDL